MILVGRRWVGDCLVEGQEWRGVLCKTPSGLDQWQQLAAVIVQGGVVREPSLLIIMLRLPACLRRDLASFEHDLPETAKKPSMSGSSGPGLESGGQ